MRQKRMEKMRRGQGTDKSWVLNRLRSRAFLQPFGIIVGMRSFAQWSGMPILTFYMVTVVEGSGSTLDPKLAPIMVGVSRVISSCLATFLIHRLKRKVIWKTCFKDFYIIHIMYMNRMHDVHDNPFNIFTYIVLRYH